MKAPTSETYRARTVRIGFEPSEPFDEALRRFGNQSNTNEIIVQSTALQVIDLADEEARLGFEQGATTAARSLRALGRGAVSFASGIEMQQSPQSLRLFFTPDDPYKLKNVTKKMESVRGGETFDRPRPGLFVDIAQASLRGVSRDDVKRAATMLKKDFDNPDERRGMVVRNPRLIIRDVGRFPRRNGGSTR